MVKKFFALFFSCFISLCYAKPPDLTPAVVNEKVNEIMQLHAEHHALTPQLIERTLKNYLELLDPTKTYFLAAEIEKWADPSDENLKAILNDYRKGDFTDFFSIHDMLVKAIARRRALETELSFNATSETIDPLQLKQMTWCKTHLELRDRIEKIQALQIETSKKLDPEIQKQALERISKYRKRYEDRNMTPQAQEKRNLVLVNVLKATAASLDSQTAYFTPEEASQLLIDVQQRLFGIGAQLRDDLNGLSIVQIIKGGPADKSNGTLQLKDRIIAVNGEPIVGMDIIDAVQLVRGKEGSLVSLTIVRGKEPDEKTVEIQLIRGEVVIEDSRYEVKTDPYGDGLIAHLQLFTFYQDPNNSSRKDLEQQIEKLKKSGRLKGCILDLRNNGGGLLTQAVEVAGLFIKKGIVVSVKDNSGAVHHLRNTNEEVAWDGPLIVLVNRGSASASEIVAQTLQDYGRAIVVGDDRTFGKGSFQLLTLKSGLLDEINPQGEYKVTMGRYYTVSGNSPQPNGVKTDIIVPGFLSEMELGERFAKYPLEEDKISSNYEDTLADIPFFQRIKIEKFYLHDLQKKTTAYTQYLPQLKENSSLRLENNPLYQSFLSVLKGEDKDEHNSTPLFFEDLQLQETYQIMKDLIYMSSFLKK